MTNDELQALADTSQRAKEWLLNPDGTVRGVDWSVKWVVLGAVFRAATPQEQVAPRPDHLFVSWRGRLFLYDAGSAEIWLEAAEKGNYFCDQIARNAASLLLEATGHVSHDQLRKYACKALSGELPEPKVDSRTTRNVFRDQVISLQLIMPLIQRGFSPTRNDTTERECASSLCSKALAQNGIDLSERRLAEIWWEAVSRSPGLEKLTKI